MFGFFKKKAPVQQASSDSKAQGMVSIASRLLATQFMMGSVDDERIASYLSRDFFALGYVFGLADHAAFQVAEPTPSQEQSVAFIRAVFCGMTTKEQADDLLTVALSLQQDPDFSQGRDMGASELGDWVKTQGQRVPMSLAAHLSGKG